MLDQVTQTAHNPSSMAWPSDGVTRVPYWIFQDRGIYAAEQERIFQGPSWNYLCLAVEVKNTGDFVTTFVGDTPVIVSARFRRRDLRLREPLRASRRADRLESRGNAKAFTCVYHAWSYDRQGNLTGVAFKDGVKGKGGMPAVVLHGAAQPAQAAGRRSLRHHLRDFLERRAAARGISR